MKPKMVCTVLQTFVFLFLIVRPGHSVGPYYEEYFTDGTTDISWQSAWYDSLGNELTPMEVENVPGNPSGDGWVGVVQADTAQLGGLALAIAGDSALTDYVMEAQVWVDITNGSYYEGIMMRLDQDPETGVAQGYQLVSNFYPPFGLQRVRFRKYSSIPDDIVILRDYSASEIPGGVPTQSSWHHFKIVAQGNLFWLYWDGQEFPDNPQTDTTATPISSGKFGIYGFKPGEWTQVMSDDIIVSPSTLVLTGPTPGLAGMNNTLTAASATPGERVYFIYGFASGSANVPGCPGVTVDITNPQIIGFSEADQNGEASITAFVPGPVSGRRILFQAVEVSNCKVSNLVTYTFP